MVWSRRYGATSHVRRRRPSSAGAACLAAGVIVLSGCASAVSSGSAPSASEAGSASTQAGFPRAGEAQALTARGLVNALNSAGFEVPNPLDTTAQDCAAAGCRQSITTDTLRVESFASTPEAQRYAAERGLYQVETVVVSFAPPLRAAEKARYRNEIQKLVD